MYNSRTQLLSDQKHNPENVLHHLQQLSQKPGVHSTLILSRATGAIVHHSGLPTIAELKEAELEAESKQDEDEQERSETARRGAKLKNGVKKDVKTAEEVAGLVVKMFRAMGEFAQGMDEHEEEAEDDGGGKEEEVRLMRLRLRKREVVVVPDAKFLLVVIHDAHRPAV